MAKKIDWASESKGAEGTLERVEPQEGGWFVTSKDDLSFFVENTHCKTAPKVGEKYALVGSFGYALRGIEIAGRCYRYLTQAAEAECHRAEVAAAQQKRQDEVDAQVAERDAKVAALPRFFHAYPVVSQNQVAHTDTPEHDEYNGGYRLSGFDLRCDADGQDEPMTLIIAAKANDGIAVVADTREARPGGPGWYSDGVPKVHHIGLAIVAAAGPGQWLTDLLDREFGTMSPTEPVESVATALHAALERQRAFPDMIVLVAGAVPTPTIRVIERKRVRDTLDWARPVLLRQPCLALGITSEAERRLASAAISDTLDTAARCVCAIRATSRQTYFVSRESSVHALTMDGVWVDEKRVEARANELERL